MWDALLKMNPGRKFIFAIIALVVITLFWGYMKYDAATYKDLIVALFAAFFTSQAVVDWKAKSSAPTEPLK